MKRVDYEDAVFINCPFDDAYNPILKAIIFAIYRCGFVPRSALEADNGLQSRLDKIQQVIAGCQYGIHDISRTSLNENGLPRFNMPFELGLFFGAQRYGNGQQQIKNAVIFDTERFRYQQFISDLNGVDIKEHQNKPDIAIQKIRNWLSTASGRSSIPGYAKMIAEYKLLLKKMPGILKQLHLDEANLTFNNYCLILEERLVTSRFASTHR
jgi:hypothetical protein